MREFIEIGKPLHDCWNKCIEATDDVDCEVLNSPKLLHIYR